MRFCYCAGEVQAKPLVPVIAGGVAGRKHLPTALQNPRGKSRPFIPDEEGDTHCIGMALEKYLLSLWCETGSVDQQILHSPGQILFSATEHCTARGKITDKLQIPGSTKCLAGSTYHGTKVCQVDGFHGSGKKLGTVGFPQRRKVLVCTVSGTQNGFHGRLFRGRKPLLGQKFRITMYDGQRCF